MVAVLGFSRLQRIGVVGARTSLRRSSASGVSFDTSNYLATHPDVNIYFTSLMGQPKDQIRAQVQTYLDANPQAKDDLQRIRQPAVDFRTRCPKATQ